MRLLKVLQKLERSERVMGQDDKEPNRGVTMLTWDYQIAIVEEIVARAGDGRLKGEVLGNPRNFHVEMDPAHAAQALAESLQKTGVF